MWRRIVSSHAETPVAFHLASNRSAISASSSDISRHVSSEELYVNNKLEDVTVTPNSKRATVIVKSYSGKRVLGCPGGEGKDRHEVVPFRLEKGKPFECPVCSQYFELKVVGHRDDDRIRIPPFWRPSP